MMKRPFEIYILSLLILFLSCGAIYGGGSLILAPDGSLLQMDKAWIELSPFPNYVVPGILLFLFLGIFPLMALVGLYLKKPVHTFDLLNIFAEKYWCWTFSLYSGVISIIWIVVQQLLTNYFILQPIIAGNGILIIIFCLIPRVQRFYTINKPDESI